MGKWQMYYDQCDHVIIQAEASHNPIHYLKIYTLSNAAEDPMVIILTFKIEKIKTE
jgi:hypothetical protein